MEARITIPSGGWTASLTESGGGGAQAITFTAGDTYYWRSEGSEANNLEAELKAKLEAASVAAGNSNTYAVGVSDSDAGAADFAGQLSLSVLSGTFTLTSVSASLLALLGFDGDLTPTAANFLGDSQVQGWWLPGCPAWGGGLVTSGHDVIDGRLSVAPDGTTYGLQRNRYTMHSLRWEAVAKARTWQDAEDVTGESWERFKRHGILGEASWGTAGGPIRWHPGAGDDDSYSQWAVDLATAAHDPPRVRDDWDGLFVIDLPTLIGNSES